MSKIVGSVGLNADNFESDVRLVQQLLNRQNLAPLKPVPESGSITSGTIEAIRHFQVRYVGMNSPDGRIDPGGRTLRKLSSGSSQRGIGENAETRKADRQARSQLVDPRVRETGVTSHIIDALVPHLLNIRAKIISGYLSDTDLFWKVNYHWEYLLQIVTHSFELPLEKKDKESIQNIRSSLSSCTPNPGSGYTNGALGKPVDKSSMDDMTRRHRILSQCKQEFKKLIISADLKTKSNKSSHAFDLSVAPVAHPGTSKHSTGYALDIEGDNSAIKSICKSHGATLVFDEKSHVHVEFKNGVS